MIWVERAVRFNCEDAALVGIVTEPPTPADVGVVIVVGGPQYRVGSHRQFVHLARQLAEQGVASIRFDYRGMGDSEGERRSFEEVDSDIAAAVAELRRQFPCVKRVVLWGLCDGASAALIALPTVSVAGVVALNPWVHTEAVADKALVTHYYGRRLLSAAFWRKLLRGEVPFFLAGIEFIKRVAHARFPRDRAAPHELAFQQKMLVGLQKLRAPALVVLSGRDLTAAEFDAFCAEDSAWTAVLSRPSIEIVRLPDADHTFSSASARHAVEALDRALRPRL